MTEENLKIDNQNGNKNITFVEKDNNGNGNGPSKLSRIPHSVSIIVQSFSDDDDSEHRVQLNSEETSLPSETDGSESFSQDFSINVTSVASPGNSCHKEDVVQTIMATAKLRKEEFARLLEEHAEIVNEINRAETNFA